MKTWPTDLTILSNELILTRHHIVRSLISFHFILFNSHVPHTSLLLLLVTMSILPRFCFQSSSVSAVLVTALTERHAMETYWGWRYSSTHS